MSFALRGAATSEWVTQFGLTNEQAGWVNGTAFWGFTLAMVVGGPLVDALGLARIVSFAFVGHAVGIALTIAAWNFWSLFLGTLVFGVANGCVEAACNPLVAALYPKEQTTKLNHFHVWFPGGIVIGGVLSFILGKLGVGWRLQFAAMAIPLFSYGLLFLRQPFPLTERVQRGESTASMFRACMSPGFLLMVGCMLLTAATELGPGQWIPTILEHAGVSGILVLVWITGLMAVGRMFAGAFVHRLSPIGMLVGSAIASAAGLYVMSHTTGAMLFVAATLFAVGVCFFWPTMLGFVAENYPKTGALGLAVMGGAGMLSVSLVLPVIGGWYDAGIQERTPKEGLPTGEALAAIQSAAGLDALGKVALLPVVLTLVFMAIAVSRRRKAPEAIHAV